MKLSPGAHAAVRVGYLGHTGPFARELAEAVACAGHEVTFVSFYDRSLGPFFDPTGWKGVQVFRIEPSLRWRFAAANRAIRRVIQTADLDILHCHYAFPYGFHGSITGAKRFVLSHHGSDAYYDAWKIASPGSRRLDAAGVGRPLFAAAHRYLAARADRLVVGSPDLVGQARRLGYPAHRLRRCDIGVDASLFHPGRRDVSLRATLLEPFDDGHLIMCTRGFKPVYGPLDLVRAHRLVVDRFPNAVLVLADTGPEELEVRNAVTRLDLANNVRFVGLIPHSELGRWMASSDVLCSVAYSDTASMSVLEGMACGLPIVATSVGAIPFRLSQTRGGTLVEPGDVAAIAREIMSFLEDSNGRAAAGERNAAFIRKSLTFAQTVSAHLDVYRELVQG